MRKIAFFLLIALFTQGCLGGDKPSSHEENAGYADSTIASQGVAEETMVEETTSTILSESSVESSSRPIKTAPMTSLSSSAPPTTLLAVSGYAGECDNAAPEDKDLCFFGYSMSSEDYSVCDEIIAKQTDEVDDYRNYCFLYGAIHAGDTGLCDRLSSADMKYWCVANITKDLSVCDKIISGDVQMSCYSDFVKAQKNISICDRITLANLRSVCYDDYAIAHDMPELCEKQVDPDSKDSCYMDVSRQNFDAAACGKVTLQSKEYCYTLAAMGRKDYKLCDLIPKESWEEFGWGCYETAALAADDRSVCDRIPAGRPEKGICYASLAKDPSLCVKVSNAIYRENCYMRLARLTGDETLCESSGEGRDTCLKYAAQTSIRYEPCEKMKDSLEKWLCISVVARAKNNIRKCAEVKDMQARKTCYETFSWDSLVWVLRRDDLW